MNNIDLKTLLIFSELHRTRSVSLAAANLHSTQSTVSMTLGRLRRHFGDTLFVRTSVGMQPTPLASELLQGSVEALALLQTMLDHHHAPFAPETTGRTFRMAMTDIGQVVTLPRLLRRLGEIAPGVMLEVSLISEHTPALLEAGKIDLAMGFLPSLDAGFIRQRLFHENFVCMFRRDHPRIGRTLTLDMFLAEAHAIIRPSGTGHRLLEHALRSKRIERRCGVEIPNFLGVSAIVESTDYLATVPSRLAVHWCQRGIGIRALPLPFTVPDYMVMLHWHERYKQDPGVQWLRKLVFNLDHRDPMGEPVSDDHPRRGGKS